MDGLMARAERHSRRLRGSKLHLFWLGFHAGQQAEQAGENTARVLHALISEHPAQAAGYLEGLAAARGVTA